MRWLLAVLLLACSGGSTPRTEVDAPPIDVDAPSREVCTGATYDSCIGDNDCSDGNCHLFMMSAIQICTTPCTLGDHITCSVDIMGANGFCSGMGICKPAMPNACTR